MKFKSLLVVFFVSLIISSCQSDSAQKNKLETEVIITTVSGEMNKILATIEISGMSCEMSCGSKIKKALNDLPETVGTEIQFDPEKELDYAIVELSSEVEGSKIISAVEDLGNGELYKVKKLKIEKIVVDQAGQNESTHSEGGSVSTNSINASSGLPIEFPNFFELISNLIR